MLEFIPSPEDVVALKVRGAIEGKDLDAIMDRLDEVLAKHQKAHVYVETQGISSLEISALPHYASRALPLFGKLDRFGRVAVVADQAWVRVGTRLESAILPGLSYRTFEPKDRDQALAWALTGKETAEA